MAFKVMQIILFALVGLITTPVLAEQLRVSPTYAHIIFQLGGFQATQGETQNIGINGLIGDRFTVTSHTDENVLLGLGYFIDGLKTKRLNLLYGINAFYLTHTYVKGAVVQEHLFTNLSYQYAITNWPIYLAVKSFSQVNDTYSFTFDLGVGPNIIQTSHFREYSLDGGVTIPDNAFSGKSNIAFSASAGFGLLFNHGLGRLPLEIAYRFFYLGQGSLKKNTNQLLSNLTTGNSYANALILSTSL